MSYAATGLRSADASRTSLFYIYIYIAQNDSQAERIFDCLKKAGATT